MSQCHDPYDADTREVAVAHIEWSARATLQGLTPRARTLPSAVHAVATLNISGEELTGTGDAIGDDQGDKDAQETAIGRALVALGSSMVHRPVSRASA
jgi:hypothetical protein